MKILKDNEYQAQIKRLNDLEQQLTVVTKELEAKKKIEVDGKSVVVTPGASSNKDVPTAYDFLNKSLNIVNPDFDFDCIILIRKLCKNNANFSQVINDLTRLSNTGHKVKFNPEVGQDQVDKMRTYVEQSSKHWHVGAAGVNGVVNKMFRQIFQGGAVSTEWIPNSNLDDLEELRFINPENIRFVLEKNTKGFQPYQRIKNIPIGSLSMKDLRKLNTKQYRYYAINGDTDLPYGIPPFMSALPATAAQKAIFDNINQIVKTLGAFGFMDAKIAKPQMKPGETEPQYSARLKSILQDMKVLMKKALLDGGIVGFIDDHEFEFKSTTKDAVGVREISDMVDNNMAAGLGTDPVFMGRPGASETLVTVMFSKMIAQLKNIQDVVKENLEFGYRLLLTLGGFSFKSLSVEFNASTITDDLKYQQAQEIKIRNLVIKFHYGIIDLEQFADELGYLAADQKEPRIDINNSDPMTGEVKKQKREEGKDKSAVKSRDKKNPRGTVKKQANSSEPGFEIDNEAKIIRM